MKITFVVDKVHDIYKRDWTEKVTDFLFQTPGCVSANDDTFGWRYHNKELIANHVNSGHVDLVSYKDYTYNPYSYYVINIGRIEHLLNPTWIYHIDQDVFEFLNKTNMPILLFYALEGTGFLRVEDYKNIVFHKNNRKLKNKFFILSLTHYNDIDFNEVRLSDLDLLLEDFDWIHSVSFFARYANKTMHTDSTVDIWKRTNYIIKDHDYKNKKYNFLCLNNTPSHNRIMILKMLYADDKLYNSNLISNRYTFTEDPVEMMRARTAEIQSIINQEKQYTYDENAKEFLASHNIVDKATITSNEYIKFLIELLYKPIAPVTVIPGDGPATNDNFDLNWFYDSIFSLVTETYQWTHETSCNHTMITEKTTKCFVQKHPFIIYGYGNSHLLCQKYGFKTFDSVFGLPRDLGPGNITMTERLYNIMKFLKNFDISKIDINLVKEYTEYNYNRLVDTDWHKVQCDLLKDKIRLQSNL